MTTPQSFGVPAPDGLLAGEWFMINNVRLDLAALNKVETLLWDIWGAAPGGDDDVTDDVRDLYHRVALLTCHEIRFDAARTAFTDNDDLRTPPTVLSLAPFNGPRHVILR